MTRFICFTTAVLLILTLGPARAQDQGSTPPISGQRTFVVLPAGYKIQVIPGIDSAGGKIWKDGGLTIEVELCCGFGNATESTDKNQVLWRQEQSFNGQLVVCVYTKSKELIVSFPKLTTNFRAKIHNQKELAEMLLIVLTFEPHQGYATDPGAIVPNPPSPTRTQKMKVKN
jgi:hypothetical protein